MRVVALIVGLVSLVAVSSGCVEFDEGKISIDMSKVSEITSKVSVSGVSIKDILNTPQDYLNKSVIVEGIPYSTIAGKFSNLGMDFTLKDKQGYIIPLAKCKEENTDRIIYTGISVYKVKGKIKAIDTCVCQSRKIVDGEREEWDDIGDWRDISWGGHPEPRSNCEKPAKFRSYISKWAHSYGVKMDETIEYRCNPESQKLVYYLECTESMIKK